MKKILLFTFFFCLTFGLVAAQLYPKDYDAVDFAFDSLYSVKYQKYLREKDAISLSLVYADLEAKIQEAGARKELIISNSTINILPLGIEKLVNIERVVFANCKNLEFEKVLEQLAPLKNIQYLELSNCGLYSLPANIEKMSSLQSLNLKENKIVRLPEELQNLKSLKTLDVSNGTVINEDFLFALIAKMPQLTDVSANYCNIRALPSIASQTQFNHLNLSGNLLTKLPIDLKVKNLDISSNPFLEIEVLFSNLANYKMLEHLNLSYNKWESIPASIGKLLRLKSLNLRGNRLTILPEEIGNLVALKVLKVDNPDRFINTNQLITLPSGIGKLEALDSLFLSGNIIASLPASFNKLSNLVYLDLSWNKLESFPKAVLGLSKLQYLDLALNHVILIPDELVNLSELKYLNLQGDFFVNYKLKINNLPANLGKLTKLETLVLSDNVIEVLPESIGQCKQLKKLDLKDNLFAKLPASFGDLSNLQHLDLKANELKSLPLSFSNLKGLEYLNLSFNFNIESNAAAALIGELGNLKTLNITDSYFTQAAVEDLLDTLPTTNIISQTVRKEKE
jgi:Leucine-rich repeat (LRR) protein